MIVTLIARTVEVALAGWLVLTTLFVLYGMFSQKIIMSGILRDRFHPDPKLDRLQLMAATILVAVFYFITALKTPVGGHMPTIPNTVLCGLLGSHALYLSGHAVRNVRNKRGAQTS